MNQIKTQHILGNIELISVADIMNAIPILKYQGGMNLAIVLHRLMKIDKINKLYAPLHELSAIDFIDSLISQLDFHFEVEPTEVQNIPRNGPFIAISNHAYGGIDGIILMKLLHDIRPDFKILMNFLLTRIRQIGEFGLKVNPFETAPNAYSNFGGLKEALNHVRSNHPLVIFPAGEVASFNLKSMKVEDKKWPHSVVKLIRKASVPIVPIYFEGHNGFLFNLLGMVHPMIRTARLPAEMLNKSGKIIHVRIGRPISLKEQNKLTDINNFGRFLRMRTFSLGIDPEKSKRSYALGKQEPLVQPVHPDLIANEIEKLKSDSLLFSINENFVFCVSSDRIPETMKELGRLREITYREVGEGTNKSLDIDNFDLYYHQLFIWDAIDKKITGGYRVGFGKQIVQSHGINGFYLSTLFHISDRFTSLLQLSMELGRSFIIKSCQKKPLSLFLLWKGILYLLCKHPEYRYMIGPVSISNACNNLSKALTVEFLRKNHYNKELAAFFAPRKKFIRRFPSVIKKRVFHKATVNGIGSLDNFIQAFDPAFQTPVLIKKYLSINSEVLGFNVDPLFNNCLDVLIMTDILDIPQETIRALSREFNDHTILERFTIPDATHREPIIN